MTSSSSCTPFALKIRLKPEQTAFSQLILIKLILQLYIFLARNCSDFRLYQNMVTSWSLMSILSDVMVYHSGAGDQEQHSRARRDSNESGREGRTVDIR